MYEARCEWPYLGHAYVSTSMRYHLVPLKKSGWKLNSLLWNMFRRTSSQCWVIRHGDVMKWKYFPRHWRFVRGIHRSPVNSPHKGQRRGALMFLLICARINGSANNREAGDKRRHRAHYDVNVMGTMTANNMNLTHCGAVPQICSVVSSGWTYITFLSRRSCWIHLMQFYGKCTRYQ